MQHKIAKYFRPEFVNESFKNEIIYKLFPYI